MLLPVPQFPLQNPKSAHCWGLKDCLLQAQLPSPAPSILNPFGGCKMLWEVLLLCTPKSWERAGTHSTLLLQAAPTPALPLSHGTPRRANFWEVSLHLKKPTRGRILLKARGEPPQCLIPAALSPDPPGTQTRQRSLGDVTQETDMTVKWALEKLLNAGRVTRACQCLLKK